MNTKPSDEKLKELFKEMPLQNPSSDFTRNLMVKIEKEAIRQKRKKEHISLVFMILGVMGIILIPGTILYFIGIEFTSFNASFLGSVIKDLNINVSVLMLGIVVLGLLIGDTLLRRHFSKRKHDIN